MTHQETKLPEPDTHCWDDDTQSDCWSYSPELVRRLIVEAEQRMKDRCAEVADKLSGRCLHPDEIAEAIREMK